MKYKHIVFDVDGTLLDSEEAVLRSLQDTMIEVKGEKIPFEELTFVLGIPGEDGLRQLQVEDIPTVMRRWEELLWQYGNTVKVYEGIEELVRKLSESGCCLGVATSRTRKQFNQDVGRFAISKYFDVVICADDTAEHKPTAGPLLKYMELAGADKGEVLYIGDSVYDSQCAQNAGVDFALAVWGSHTETTRADYYLHKPMDFMQYQQ